MVNTFLIINPRKEKVLHTAFTSSGNSDILWLLSFFPELDASDCFFQLLQRQKKLTANILILRESLIRFSSTFCSISRKRSQYFGRLGVGKANRFVKFLYQENVQN